MKNSIKISKILVFSEEPRTRVYVGKLIRTVAVFSFQYDEDYMERASATPLGPDLPFSMKPIQSKSFFESLHDLIPSRANPAYVEYCRSVGIDAGENDPMVLLAYLGRGPSSFVFEPEPDDKPPTGDQVVEFRDSIGLSQRQFARFLDIPFPSLQAIEKDASQVNTARRLIQVYMENVATLKRLLVKRGIYLGQKKQEQVRRYILDYEKGPDS